MRARERTHIKTSLSRLSDGSGRLRAATAWSGRRSLAVEEGEGSPCPDGLHGGGTEAEGELSFGLACCVSNRQPENKLVGSSLLEGCEGEEDEPAKGKVLRFAGGIQGRESGVVVRPLCLGRSLRSDGGFELPDTRRTTRAMEGKGRGASRVLLVEGRVRGRIAVQGEGAGREVGSSCWPKLAPASQDVGFGT